MNATLTRPDASVLPLRRQPRTRPTAALDTAASSPGRVPRPDGARPTGHPGGRPGARLPTPSPCRDAAPASTLHLTRRGRIVVVVGSMLLIMAGFGLGRASSSSAADTAPATVTVVQPHDTLWSIAERVDPHQDPRITMTKLRAANHLSSFGLQAGQTLTLPR